MNYQVVEIFDSIEGEGKRAGQTATFIRLAGCNLRCSYCDTTYAFGNEYKEMALKEIMTKLKSSHISRITLTGGEPLAAQNVEILIYEMLVNGYEVNIETNGSIDTAFLFKHLQNMKYEASAELFLTMDYKLPSSGVNDKMTLSNFPKLNPWDVLKFVVGSEEDVVCMINFVRKLTPKPQIFIGAVYGKYDLQKLVNTIVKTPELKDAKLQLQLHKIIWDANERGV